MPIRTSTRGPLETSSTGHPGKESSKDSEPKEDPTPVPSANGEVGLDEPTTS